MSVYVVQRNTDDKVMGAFATLELARAYVSVQLPIRVRTTTQHKFCEVDTNVLPFREIWNGYCILGLEVVEAFSFGDRLKDFHREAEKAINSEAYVQARLEGLI